MASQANVEKKMPYVRLGNSGLKVSRIILGCMTYGDPAWSPWVLGEEEGVKHIKAAYDKGVNAFDTADMYSNGVSEVIVGKAIKQHNLPRENLVIMTKVFNTVGRTPGEGLIGHGKRAIDEGYVNQSGLSRKHIFESVKASLERLQLDYIDLLQCHRFDYDTPIEETMTALHDVVKSGMVRYIGMSSCWAYQLQAMQNYALNNKLTPFISMQNFHNLIYREEEREVMPTCEMLGLGVIPWSPLARGFLTRPFTEKTLRAEADQGFTGRGFGTPDDALKEINRRVEKVAKAKGVSMAQVALAWSLSKPYVSAPIVGTTKLENLRDLIDGIHLKLTEEEIKTLEEPYVPRAINGHA